MHRRHTSAVAFCTSSTLPHAPSNPLPPPSPCSALAALRRRLAPLHHNRPPRALQAVQHNSEMEIGGTPTKSRSVSFVKGQFGHQTKFRYRHYSGTFSVSCHCQHAQSVRRLVVVDMWPLFGFSTLLPPAEALHLRTVPVRYHLPVQKKGPKKGPSSSFIWSPLPPSSNCCAVQPAAALLRPHASHSH